MPKKYAGSSYWTSWSLLLWAIAVLLTLLPSSGSPPHASWDRHGHVHELEPAWEAAAGESCASIGACVAASFLSHVGEDHSHEQKYYATAFFWNFIATESSLVADYARPAYGAPVFRRERPPDGSTRPDPG